MVQHSLGERFGDYKLIRPLGEGGFASVYLGEEVHKGTPAAIKLPKEQQVHDFINELRRTVLLQHPNIIKILDFGIRTPDNTAFIIMEYAPHGSFRDKYPRGTSVPPDVVIRTVKQVASALQYAHDQRVIHRDVKPENLLLNARNMVLLSDFGIATASRTAMKSNVEQAGQGDIIGTYAYMAPEQLKGRPVTASDQYSLAIMVYEWVCGELPFEGREYIQWYNLHKNEPPPSLRDHVPTLPLAVEQVVLRALAKKPEERFENVETFALALEQAARGEDISSIIASSASAKHASQFASASVGGRPTNGPFQTSPNTIEQLFQEGVRLQANGNTEEAFRIWRQVMTTQGVAERYSTTAHNRIRELRSQMIPLRLKQAREASMQGRWQDEIHFWEDLLALEPSTEDLVSQLTSPLTIHRCGSIEYSSSSDIQERLNVAQRNEQSSWMYESARQFIQNRDYAAASTQLQMLWQDAPYYGDPANLATTIGLPAALNYDQAIVAEQARLEQERVERERQEREREAHLLAREKRQKLMSLLLPIIGGVVGSITGIIAGILLQKIIGNEAGLLIGGSAGLLTGGIVGGMSGHFAAGESISVYEEEVPPAKKVADTIIAGIAAGITAGVVAGWIAAGLVAGFVDPVGKGIGFLIGIFLGWFASMLMAGIVGGIVTGINYLIGKRKTRKKT